LAHSRATFSVSPPTSARLVNCQAGSGRAGAVDDRPAPRSYGVRVPGAAPRPNRDVLKRGAERMASRNLSKRLERLEERMLPAGEPLIVQIQFVSPDGTVEDGPQVIVPGAGGRRLGKEFSKGKPCPTPSQPRGRNRRAGRPQSGMFGCFPSNNSRMVRILDS
jgi:hypothetical protein